VRESLWSNFSSLVGESLIMLEEAGGLEKNPSIIYRYSTYIHVLYIFLFWLDTNIFIPFFSSYILPKLIMITFFFLLTFSLHYSYKGLYFTLAFFLITLSQRTCIEGRNVLYTRLEFFPFSSFSLCYFFRCFGLGLLACFACFID